MVKKTVWLFVLVSNFLSAEIYSNLSVNNALANQKDFYNELEARIEYQEPVKYGNIDIIARGLYSSTNFDYHDFWFEKLTFAKKIDNASFIIGKQIVTWGESDYFRIVNILNPLDLRDYYLSYLKDPQSATRSLWSANFEYFGDEYGVQLIWIPEFNGDRLPFEGSGFSNTQIEYVSSLKGIEPTDFSLKDSSFAMRLNTEIYDFDTSAYFYHGWNFSPTLTSFNEKSFFRRDMMGTSISKEFGDIVVRAEGAIYLNDILQNNMNYEKQNVYKSLLGIDWAKGDLTISTQYTNTNSKLRKENEFSLFVQKNLSNNNWILNNILLHNFTTDVGLNEFKIKYRYTDTLNVDFGYVMFWGKNGILSNYASQDRFFVNFEYYFN